MESLKKTEQFRKCYSTGKSYVNRYLVLYVCGNGLGRNRIGISVSKKVGNSVVRHRITRLIRESSIVVWTWQSWRVRRPEMPTITG